MDLSTRGGAHPNAQTEDARINQAAATVTTTTASPELLTKLKRVSYLASPVAQFEVDLLQDVQALRDACCRPDGEIDLIRMAQELCALGYACSLQFNDPAALADSTTAAASAHHQQQQHQQQPVSSTAGPVRVDTSCLEKFRHSFIVCTGRTGSSSVAHYCIVDPQFRDQFQLGQSSETYDAVLSVVSAEFVGSPVRLQSLANLLCAEIVEVYETHRLSLPPWRKSAAMLSKWFDVSATRVPPPTPTPPRPPPPPPPLSSAHAPLMLMSSPPEAAPPSQSPFAGSAKKAGQIDRPAVLSPVRTKSGGWSDLATIQEAPSPHHRAITVGQPATTVFFAGDGGEDTIGSSLATSASSSAIGDGGRQKQSGGGGRVVSLLAKGLSGLGLSSSSSSFSAAATASKNGNSSSLGKTRMVTVSGARKGAEAAVAATAKDKSRRHKRVIQQQPQ